MHTIWKGAISFGLVNIPVRMFAATENKDIRFRMLHRECNTPLKQVRVCPSCDRQVSSEEVVQGFEYQSGRFVIVDEEDLQGLATENNRTVELIDFVDLHAIDPLYYDRSYYLAPQEPGASKAFALLHQAMSKAGKVGLAKITMRFKESLAVIRNYGPSLVLETIYYPDEVRPVEDVPGLSGEVAVSDRELDMAVQLVENLSTPFEPAKYRNEYREGLEKVIAAKVEGRAIKEPRPTPAGNIVDLMEALQASIQATQDKPSVEQPKVPARKRTRKAKTG